MRSRPAAILPFVLLTLLISSCGDDPTSPIAEPEPAQTILMDRLMVSMVPGASEHIEVIAELPNGADDPFESVQEEDAAVAGCNLIGSQLTVTGLDVGETNIVLTTVSGARRLLPVRVYDPKAMDVGGMLITYVDQFEYRWSDIGSGGKHDGYYLHPIVPEGWHALGSLGKRGYANPSGHMAVIIVKELDDSGAIAAPIDYEFVYNDIGSGADNDGSFWRPVPPSPEYVAMGLVAQRGYGKPALTEVVCVRKDLTVPGRAGAFVWNDDDTGANIDFGSWEIAIPVSGTHEIAYVAPGCFVGWNRWNQPQVGQQPEMNVLKIPFTMLTQADYDSFVPRLDSHEEPPERTAPTLARAMLVPFTAVYDPFYGENLHWMVENSPFYRLERSVYYKLRFHYDNQGSVQQDNTVTDTVGAERTESETFRLTTGISVTSEGGVEFMGIGGKVSCTVSVEFGYESSSSISSLEYHEVTKAVSTPPGKAAALWQKSNTYLLKRHNGIYLETVSPPWEFGIDSYVVAEYPPPN